MQCMLKGCIRCHGDLFLDEGDWRCIQCAQYYYGALSGPGGECHPILPFPGAAGEAVSALALSYDSGKAEGPVPEDAKPRGRPRTVRRTRSSRSVNSIVRARDLSDARWWVRNKEIIDLLDQGIAVRRIADQCGRGPRQVRLVRERLIDLRAEAAMD